MKSLFFHIKNLWAKIVKVIKHFVVLPKITLKNKTSPSSKTGSKVGTRPPKPDIKTKPFLSIEKDKPWLSPIPTISPKPPLKNWSLLSQQILCELFAELGVEHVPEIVLHQSQEQDPVSAFITFCNRFEYQGIAATRGYLQDVVLFLFQMDELRRRHSLTPDPIYEQLYKHQWCKAEILLDGLEKAINLLNKLDKPEDVHLGQHRRILNNIKDILFVEWFKNLDSIDKWYEIQLSWVLSEKKYDFLQKQIVARIETIDKIQEKKIAVAYENIKRNWQQCTAFLKSEDEDKGNPDDPEWGFLKLKKLCDALDVILESDTESVTEPIDEGVITIEKAWKILELKSGCLDLNLIKKAFRRKAIKNHPDKHPYASKSEKEFYHKKFIQIKEAYNKLREVSMRHG